MKVGIFGGTFDPPHLGHLGVASNSISAGLVDEVWMVPCFDHRFAKRPARFEDRIAMCKLLAAGEKRIKVLEIEKELEKSGFTIELVTTLRSRYPVHEFRLLAGADIYHEKNLWHRYDEIVRIAPPIYVAREGVRTIPEPTLPAPVGVESSEIRAALLRGERLVHGITDQVLDYIEAHGLYKSEE